MKNYTRVLLVIGILLMMNVLSQQFFKRFDFTEGQQYTLSRATKDIVKNLEDPVTVTAYFTKGLPPQYAKVRNDFQDLLLEYASGSKGYIDYEVVDPNEDEEVEKQLAQKRIPPILFNVREKDQAVQKKGYMAAVVKMGDQEEIVPVVQSSIGMEYSLSTAIKKLSVKDKPSIGIIQGHGEPPLNELVQVYQALSVLYNVEALDLSQEASIAPRFKTVALVRPTDSIPGDHFGKMDEYLSRGGNLFVAMNAVDGDLSTAQGNLVTTGLETWLQTKGLQVNQSFLIDKTCNSVMVQQQQGFFTVQTPVEFPYLPIIRNFADHPLTKGLEEVSLIFASSISYSGDTSSRFTPVAYSSERAGTVQAPTFFDVMNKKFGPSDFPMSNLVVGGVLEGNLVGNVPSRIVLFGDGDFPISGAQGRGQSPDNINLMVNSVDWLSDDTGLIDLRTKGVASRPIEDLEDSERSTYKYLNFFLPLILVIAYGFYRSQRRRNLRMKRMQERYA
ncbi:MAG: Gldg family protein [Bacteroidota bacterium]